VIVMQRKMIAIDEDEYKKLIKLKGKLEMESGNDLSMGDTIALAATVILAGYGLSKILEELSKKR